VLYQQQQQNKRFQINNLMMQLNALEKEDQIKPKVSKRTEITKTKAEINEIETKEIQKISEMNSFLNDK
jgi:hypothetical protein